MNWLNFFKIRTKLIILSIIPILGLSFFLTQILLENNKKLLEMSQTKVTIQNIHLLHEIYSTLEKERLAVIRIANSKYLHNIEDIMLIPNLYEVSAQTNNKFDWFYKQRTIHNLPILFIQTLQKELLAIRSKNETQTLSNIEINKLYTLLISRFISVIESMLSLNTNPKVKIYLSVMKYQEVASQEVASLDDVFLSGKISKENFSDYLFKYSARKNSIKNIKNLVNHKNSLSEFINKLTEINELKIDTYSSLVISKVDKILLLSEIKSILGYGGLFFNFHNYLSNRKQEDKNKFLIQAQDMKSLVQKYKLLLPINKNENIILDNILNTVNNYYEKIDIINSVSNAQGISNNDILVLKEITSLDARISDLNYLQWHNKALKFEKLNDEMYQDIGNEILTQISQGVRSLETKNSTQLLLFCFLLLISISFIYLVNKNIIEKIAYFEKKFDDFLLFIKGDSLKTFHENIIGNDEFSLMLLKLDNDIKYVEEKINEEKNFIKNASVKLGNIKNGKFCKNLNYGGDNILISELSFVIDNFSHNLERIVININTAFLELSSGNFKHRMKLFCQGEFLLMKNSLNKTLDTFENLTHEQNLKITSAVSEIQKKDQLLAQQSKLAAMGEMVGSIAHQWRQPLNALAGNIQMVRYDYEDNIIDEDYSHGFVKDNMDLINYMSKTIDDFRNFFRIDKNKKSFNLKNTILSVANLLSAQLNDHGIVIAVKGNENSFILGLQSEFQQVILNIISNAKDEFIKQKNNKALIDVDIGEEEAFIVIKISDNAGGIPDDILDRIFEPYFTSKEQGKGTGLGLYMSKMIIEDNMDGKISAYNHPHGAIFDIRFKRDKA